MERGGESARSYPSRPRRHAALPPCGEEQALRLFAADDLIEAGVTPETLMKAQGFDPAPLDLLKAHFDPAALAVGQWARQWRMVGRRRGHSRKPPGEGMDEGAWCFHRMAPQPAERFKARDSAGKSATRPRGEETSEQSGRSNRICHGRAMEKKSPFQVCLTISRGSTPLTLAPGWRTTRSISVSRNSSPNSRNWAGRKSSVRMGRL